MKKTIYIALAALLFTACSDLDTINPKDLGDYTEKLTVNGVVSSGDIIKLNITGSTSSIDSFLPVSITDAQVTIALNGTNQTAIYDPFENMYVLNQTLNEGDEIRLDARRTGYPNVNATVYIPQSISANSSFTPNGGLDTAGIPSDLIEVEFTDDPSADNYYRINLYYYNTTLGEFIPMSFSVNDPSFTEFNSLKLNDASLLFTDELFNGQTKKISTVAPFGLVLSNPGDKYLVVLESVNEDLYRYYTTLQRARDAREGNFSSAFNNVAVIHSNINNGLGILGATYAERDTLR